MQEAMCSPLLSFRTEEQHTETQGSPRASPQPSQQTKEDQDNQLTYHDEAKTILGCIHYHRATKMQCVGCGEWWTCRLCHDQHWEDIGMNKNAPPPDIPSHKFDRYATKSMMCMFCKTKQPPAQSCSSCSKQLAEYYCDVCHLWESNPQKKGQIFHCDKCGLCRLGIREEYSHCDICNMCRRDGQHTCVPDAFKNNCPICHEDLFISTQDVVTLRCGHPMHAKCLQDYAVYQSTCPLCQKGIQEPSTLLRNHFLHLVQQNPMPQEYKDSTANILCNDCLSKCDVTFNFLGHLCPSCGSLNTRIISTNNMPDVSAFRAPTPTVVSFVNPSSSSSTEPGHDQGPRDTTGRPN